MTARRNSNSSNARLINQKIKKLKKWSKQNKPNFWSSRRDKTACIVGKNNKRETKTNTWSSLEGKKKS